jgi:hypothetical protein
MLKKRNVPWFKPIYLFHDSLCTDSLLLMCVISFRILILCGRTWRKMKVEYLRIIIYSECTLSSFLWLSERTDSLWLLYSVSKPPHRTVWNLYLVIHFKVFYVRISFSILVIYCSTLKCARSKRWRWQRLIFRTLDILEINCFECKFHICVPS